jgi:hypothetical protein
MGTYIANRYFVIDWRVLGKFLFSHHHMAYQLELLFVAEESITLEKSGTKFFEPVRNEAD